MGILVSDHLLLIGGTIVLCWLLVRFALVPLARRAIGQAAPDHVVQAGVRFGSLVALRSLLDAMLIAGVVVSAAAVGLHWYLSSFTEVPTAVRSVVQVRDQAERAIESLGILSAQMWIVCLAALALIWLIASWSASRRSWDGALSARRSALAAAIADLSSDALTERATSDNPAGVAGLDQQVQSMLSENASRIGALRSRPILQLSDDARNVASLDDLQQASKAMRKQVVELEASDADPAERAKLSASADSLQKMVKEIEDQISLPLRTLGGDRDVSLSRALVDPATAIGLREDRDRALRDLIVQGQLAKHSVMAVGKGRREPELIREWLAAGATSEAAVRTTSAVGRTAALACLVLLFLGFVGLGAQNVAPGVVSQASALELKLAALVADRDLAAAISEGAAKRPSAAPQAELASDEATAEALRQSFRASVTRSLEASYAAERIRSGATATVAARERFELGAVEARRRILEASARSAAPHLEAGQAPHAFNVRETVHLPPPGSTATAMDEALDRRIKALRANERVWTQLRMAAARPAPVSVVSEAFLRTALASPGMTTSNAMRAWTERASADFAAQAARAGRLPDATHTTALLNEQHPLLSSRERRLVADYRSGVPQRVTQTVERVRSGHLDPGSLHRDLPHTGSVPARAIHTPLHTPYGELFPAGSGQNRVAARSYAKVRFSGRVGGVLIGVSPQPGGEALDVRSIRWQITSGNALHLVLVDSDGGQFRLGPYHPAIAHHALAYAADGRVVTSTLPQPQRSQGDDIEIKARRVVVHPAFEDTAFACPAIQVDRFVDAFSRGDSTGTSRNPIALTREAVTDLGTLLPVTREPSLDPAMQSRVVQFIQDIAQHAQSCGPGANCFPIETYVKYRLDFGAAPEFLSCLSRKQEASVCVKILMSRRASSTYLVDSGVREAPFRLDRKFRFLTTADSANDRLWPLDFMIQAVPQTLAGQDVEVGENWEPWRFPNIDRPIKDAVARGIAGDGNARVVFERMRDFTILQRLFRLALAGDLGPEFPLDELVKLQRATATFVKVERSERWNVNQPLLETMAKERDGLKLILRRIVSDSNATDACRSTARRTIESDDKSPWPKFAGLWSSIGEVERVCKASAPSAELARRLSLLRRYDLIDEAINWARDDRARRGQFSCSPL